MTWFSTILFLVGGVSGFADLRELWCEVEQQRLAVTLRHLADCIEHAEGWALADVATQLSPLATALFSRAQLVFKRPFGE